MTHEIATLRTCVNRQQPFDTPEWQQQLATRGRPAKFKSPVLFSFFAMKVKRLKVGVRPIEEGMREFKNTLKALKAGRNLSKRTGVYFVSVEAMRRVLTEPRLTLLHTIRTRRPQSIAALAKLAKRDFKNVR